MCVKIISPKYAQEFNMAEPLCDQIGDASEIVVDFDPADPKVDCFLVQIETMVKRGITCKADIKVNVNNHLSGLRYERRIESLKRKLDINEVIKGVCNMAADADRKLGELSKLCLGNTDER